MAGTAKETKEIFISYHRESAEAFMHQIRAALEAAGFSCWYDERNIEGGSFPGAIVRAIRGCRVFLLILNERSNVSEHVLNEVSIAFRRYTRHEPIVILPFRVDGCALSDDMAYFLERFQMAGKSRAPEEEDLRDLIRRVAYILDREPRTVTPPPEPPKASTPPTPTQVRTPTPPPAPPKQAERPKTPPTPTTTQVRTPVRIPTPAVITRPARPDPIVIDDAGKALPPPEGRWILRQTLSAGDFHTVGIQRDGTVIATGKNNDGNGQCNVKDWRDIVSVAGGKWHTAGLRRDGTVVAVGSNDEGECDMGGWNDVVAVSAGSDFTVGLRKDGSLLAAGDRDSCPVDGWRGIVSVATGAFHTVGLRSDGTVTAGGDNEYGQCNVSGWKEIVSIAAGWKYTIGGRRDGTVVMTGRYGIGSIDGHAHLPDVSGWREIVMVAGDWYHTVGLRRDGTVVGVGDADRFRGVEEWRDIVAVSAGSKYTVGLRRDGTVALAGTIWNTSDSVSRGRLRLPEWVPWEGA